MAARCAPATRSRPAWRWWRRRSPKPVGEEFQLLYDRQNYGMPLPDALKAFAARMPLIDARFFVTAVLTQRETGGNLGEVLDNLARVIRDRFRVKCPPHSILQAGIRGRPQVRTSRKTSLPTTSLRTSRGRRVCRPAQYRIGIIETHHERL